MESPYDYKKFAVLYVDDEEMSLKYFTRAFQNQFRILTAANAQEAYRILQEHRDEIGLIMTDQRMPGEQGVQFLGRARQLHPSAIRMLTTAYSDVEVAIDAVNSGAIYRYISKPWEVPDLEVTLKRALEFFMVQRERDFLMKEKLSALQRMMITDRVLSLGIIAAHLGRHMRNSLVAVRAFLDLLPEKLLEQKDDLEEMRKPNYWNDVYSHARAQLRRVMDLLKEIASPAATNHGSAVTSMNLQKAVANALERTRGTFAQRGIEIVNHIPADLPPVIVEHERFQRLLDLLLKNELINLTAGNHLTFNARHDADEPGLVELEMKDDSAGLPRDALRAVLDPFCACGERDQELGINLLACYFIAYHHGGKIEVRSEEAEGVFVTLTCPTQAGAQASAAEDEAFFTCVLVNDAFWERVIAARE
jgi:two-component system probable response regulator PhcQ